MKGRKDCEKSKRVGGRGGGGNIRWTKDPTQGNIPSRHISHRPAVIQRQGSVPLAPRMKGAGGSIQRFEE